MFSPNRRAFSNDSSLCCIGAECTLADVPEKLNKGYSAEETRKQYLRLNAIAIRHCDLLRNSYFFRLSGIWCSQGTLVWQRPQP